MGLPAKKVVRIRKHLGHAQIDSPTLAFRNVWDKKPTDWLVVCLVSTRASWPSLILPDLNLRDTIHNVDPVVTTSGHVLTWLSLTSKAHIYSAANHACAWPRRCLATVSSRKDLDTADISPSEGSSPTSILANWSASALALSDPHSIISFSKSGFVQQLTDSPVTVNFFLITMTEP